jgi:hypothetical protein
MVVKKVAESAHQDQISRVDIAYFEKPPPSDSASCHRRIS